MIGLGTIVNVILVFIGGSVGVALKKFLPRRLTDTVMQALGLAVVVIGLGGTLSAAFTVVDGGIDTNYTLLMIISLAVGALIGELIGIEEKLDRFAKFCENKFMKSGESATSTFAQGFVTATLMFCVGSMAIIGALEDGINGNSDILFAKSTLDCISAMVFASTMGIGVLFSAAVVGIYQGSLTLLAMFIAPYLSDMIVAQMSLVGSVLIMAIGINILKIAKIKVGNLLPAVFIPVVYYVIRLIIER